MFIEICCRESSDMCTAATAVLCRARGMVSPRRHWTGAGALVFVAVRDARRARRLRPLAPLRAAVGGRRSCDAVRRLQLAEKCGSVRSNGYALRGGHPRECLYLFVRARSNASFTVW